MSLFTKPVDYEDWKEGYFVGKDGKVYHGTYVQKLANAEWVADGWAAIDTVFEHQNGNGVEKQFLIKGKPLDDPEFSFMISARDAANGKLLRAELVNKFGAREIGGMGLKVIQRISKYIKTVRLFVKPQWSEDKLYAPGLVEKIEFDFESEIAIDFTDVGNAEDGIGALKSLLKSFDQSNLCVLIAAFFGAPVIAKIWPGERFAVFIQGVTGSYKTEVAKLLMCLYGQRYALEINILRWGHGATTNALEHLAAMVGPFVFIIDNYKNYTEKDPARFQEVLHATMEGGEKKRLSKDSSLRHTNDYQCLPVITGENFPGQDAASRARVVVIPWIKPKSTNGLTEAQKHAKDLNALGKEWCLWLSSDEGKGQMELSAERFDAVRSEYLKQVGDAINAGRIATNAALLHLIWDLMFNCPILEDFAEEYSEVLKVAIEDHIVQSRAEVAEDLDAERFMDWLRAELVVGRYIVANPPEPFKYHDRPTMIGKFTDAEPHFPKGDLLIEPSVFKSILVQQWQKSTMGARADIRSLLRQLVLTRYLDYDSKSQQYTRNRSFGDKRSKRVYVFDWGKVVGEDVATGHQ